MLNICQSCPLNPKNVPNAYFCPGDTSILINEEGNYSVHAYTDVAHGSRLYVTDMDTPTLNVSHPDMAQSIDACNGPELMHFPISDHLARIALLHKYIHCPAVELHVNVKDVNDVRAYFGTKELT